MLRRSRSQVLFEDFQRYQAKITTQAIAAGAQGKIFDAQLYNDQQTHHVIVKEIKNHDKCIIQHDCKEEIIHRETTRGEKSSEEMGLAKYIGSSTTVLNDNRTCQIFMEKCDDVLSSIMVKISDVKTKHSANTLRFVPYLLVTLMESMQRALTHLHEHQVIHGDVKPPNIGMRFTSDGDIYFELFDFGTAKRYGEKNGVVGGTLFYAPPGVTRHPTSEIDMYALGIILKEILDIFNSTDATIHCDEPVHFNAGHHIGMNKIFSPTDATDEWIRNFHDKIVDEANPKFFERTVSPQSALSVCASRENSEIPAAHAINQSPTTHGIFPENDFMRKINDCVDTNALLHLMQEHMCQALPTNRLTLSAFSAAVKKLRLLSPGLSDSEKQELFLFYKELVTFKPDDFEIKSLEPSKHNSPATQNSPRFFTVRTNVEAQFGCDKAAAAATFSAV